MNIIWSADSTEVVKGIDAAHDFSATVSPLLIPSGGGTTSVTVKDISYDKSVAASTALGASLSVLPSTLSAAIATDTPSICSISGSTVTPLGTGDAGIIVSTSLGTRRYVQPVALNAGTSHKTTTAYTEGSLAKHIADSVSAMVAGKTAGAPTQELFSAANYDLDNPSATRNSSLFSGIDLSAISFARSLDLNTWAAWCFPLVLIAPQVALFAWHTSVGAGTQVTFMRPDGSFQKVTVSASVSVNNSDIGIAKLSAPITGITPMATLGTGYENKLPCMAAAPEQPADPGIQVPALFKGSRQADYSFANRLNVMPLYTLYGPVGGNYPPFLGSFLSGFQQWADDIVGGDSGSPTFVPINGSPVILLTQFNAQGARSIPYNRTAIDAAMTALMGVSTAMSVADLSAFTTY